MNLPLYLIHSDKSVPYYEMAHRFLGQVARLKAGCVYHFILEGPGKGRNYFGEAYATMYPFITQAIDDRPVVVLDADHQLKKPIIEIFEEDWDVAAVYRQPSPTEHGRHDYNAGSVFLNNKRPNIIRKFWLEWAFRTWAEKSWPHEIPKTLFGDDWQNSWMEDQAALNSIILPNESPEPPVIMNKIYENKGYRIRPLPKHLYGGKHMDLDAYLKHMKGAKKRK